MKKSLFFLFTVVIAIWLVALGASAEEPNEEYTVENLGDEYVARGEDGQALLRSYDLSNLIDILVKDYNAERIIFSGVYATELSLSYPITVLGSLYLEDGLVINEKGSVALSGIELNTGGIRVKGGELSFSSGIISLRTNSSLTLDYTASSRYSQSGGTLVSESGKSAVNVNCGTATLYGGAIKCPSGVSVVSNGSLYLGGGISFTSGGFDIVTSTPINLNANSEAYLGSAKIQYQSEFEKGQISTVFRSATPLCIQSIKLYDINGKEEKIVYFNEHRLVDETDFVAVYKPFSLKYTINGELIYQDEMLTDMPLELVPLPSRVGYKSIGWFLDAELTKPFDGSAKISSDLTLFGAYELLPPSFILVGKNFVYNEAVNTVDFIELVHPLDESGYYTFAWENEKGDLVAHSRELRVKNVNESGKYRCRVTFTVNGEFVDQITPQITVNIEKKRIPLPESCEVDYNGFVQYSTIPKSPYYTVSNVGEESVGVYPVELVLTDRENFIFENGESERTSVSFVINKAPNYWVEAPKSVTVYFGNAPRINVSAQFGRVSFEYSLTESGEYSDKYPEVSGTFYYRAVVNESENYKGLISEPEILEIVSEIPVALNVNTMPQKTEYVAFEYVDRAGLSFTLTYNSGRKELLDGAQASIRYGSDLGLLYGDNFFVAEYLGIRATVPITVKKAEYNIQKILSDSEFIYDGEYHTATVLNLTIIGVDGLPLKYEIVGGGTDCGEYRIILNFHTESKNYQLPPSQEATLKINPRETVLIWSEQSFVYDGTVKRPNAYYLDVFGAKVYVPVSGGAVNAGLNYIATGEISDLNYYATNICEEFRIEKAELDLSGVYWTADSFIYDGTGKAVYISGLPDNATVLGYTDNFATEAGRYSATCVIDYDKSNYNEPLPLCYDWEIKKTDYDLSGLKFLHGEYEYDGQEKFPIIEGELPCGEDGIFLTYSFSSGAVNVADSPFPVTVTFSTESKNYNIPQSLIVPVTILPHGIYVEWTELNFVYTGELFSPKAVAKECDVQVNGLRCNAGQYVADCRSLDPNYYVINEKIDFVIDKAKNSWDSYPDIGDIFEGNTPTPSAVARFGEVVFEYLDGNGNSFLPVEFPQGEYFMIARVLEGENHYSLEYEPLKFNVLPVFAIGIQVNLIKEAFFALSRVEEGDIVITASFNDGSVRTIPFSDVVIEYIKGDELRYSDTLVFVKYLDFKEEIGVTVKKAVYDMSGVYWSELESVYDGTVKEPRLLGLPDGVRVNSYTFDYIVNAGVYSLCASLEYDEDNYEMPSVTPVDYTVRKRPVKIPEYYTALYNGKPQLPQCDDPNVTFTVSESCINRGVYTVNVGLMDSNNYTLFGVEAVSFTIEPIMLFVSASDVNVYWFGDKGLPDGVIISGEVIDGEDAGIYYFVEDELVKAACENKNYQLSVIEGRVVIINGFAPGVRKALLFSFLSAFTLLIVTSAIVYKKDVLLDYLASKREGKKIAIVSAESTGATLPLSLPAYDVIECSKQIMTVDAERADELLTNSMAKTLIHKTEYVVETAGDKRVIINIDTLSDNFVPGESIDINALKKKGLVTADACFVKVLARGRIDKPLKVYLNDYSLAAIKMIALTGGEAYRVGTVKKRKGDGKTNKRSY